MGNSKKIVIVGSEGRLGKALSKVIPESIGFDKDTVDITKYDDARKIVELSNSGIIINTVAITNVDECEKDFEKAWNVNVIGAYNLGKACKDNNAYFVHISTDYVKNPTNVYAWTKRFSESSVVDGLLIRTTFYFASHWLFQKLLNNEKTELITEGFWQPLSVNTVAKIIYQLIQRNAKGIVEVGSFNHCSMYEFGKRIVMNLGLSDNLVVPVDNIKEGVLKPIERSLSIDTLLFWGIIPPRWEKDLDDFLKNLK